MKRLHINQLTTEQLSQYVLYLLIALSLLVFGAFYLVGYDHPFAENPVFNAPLLTDAVLVLVGLLLISTVTLTVYTIVTTLRHRHRTASDDNGIPSIRLSYGIAGLTLLLLVVTFLAGSPNALQINGHTYTDTLWLKTADMFVVTGSMLIVLAVATVIFGATRYYRKKQHVEKK
ncbi:hypothetical protein [Hoylesella marshii]|uniref:hypothetical protein n=1 Tax=Hoylesella marshii TaxID=189722 RepID=UPI0028D30446|nr:hypothetical protein [Hoylesella marshii]